MHTTHVRNLLNLRWKKIIVLSLVALNGAHAQSVYKRKFQENYDDKRFHLGIQFGTAITRFNIRHSDAFVSRDSAYAIFSPAKSGINAGGIVSYVLSEHFDLRFTPTLSLSGRAVTYRFNRGFEHTAFRDWTAWVDFPLLLKYKSQRRMNSRMYAVAGGQLSIETNVKRQQLALNTLNSKSRDFSVVYGAGFEQFLQHSKLTLEIRFAHGLINALQPAANAYSVGIASMNTHTINIYLIFE